MSEVHGTKMIALEDIELNYRNPRQDFSKESLKELADSLKMHGQLQPIVVRRKGGKYELIIGERRVRAAVYADISKLRAEIVDLTDAEADARRLIENIQRNDLSIWEKVDGLEAYWNTYLKEENEHEIEEKGSQNARSKYKKLSEIAGISDVAIENWYHTARSTSNLSHARMTHLRRLPLSTLEAIAPYPTDVQEKLAKAIIDKNLSRDDARAFVKLFEQNPKVDLNILANRAKVKVETFHVTLPVERAEAIKKEAEAFRKKLDKKSSKAMKHRQALRHKKEEEMKKVETRTPTRSADRLTVELEQDLVRKHAGILSVDEIHNEVSRAFASGKLSKGEADIALEVWKGNPSWELEQVIKVSKVKFQEEGKNKPQIVSLLIEPSVYSRIQRYAETEGLMLKEAVLKLVDLALEQLGYVE
jgi:ParB/RepB/Spo0J family partition protein